MNRFWKVLLGILIGDLILAVGVWFLCTAVDSKRIVSGSMTDSDTSLTMEDSVMNKVWKSDMFSDEIYDRTVIPSGEAVGIYLKTDGVMVVDVCSFKNIDGKTCCPSEDILQAGDYIVSANGEEIGRRSDLLDVVARCEGKSVTLDYVREGVNATCEVTPEQNESGNYLLGAWIKDDVSGIGTITFVDGVNFMALGHSVSDSDTGLIMRCSTGGIYTTNITHISRSHSSEPGKLQGSIAYRQDLIGIIDGNSNSGIFGHLDMSYCNGKYASAEKMYIAHGDDVHEGTAYIYSRMSGELHRYEVEIEHVDHKTQDKNMEFCVVDEELLQLTGGVVQGMSGSPIIQDGRIIGAVTHVFVDDPTRGYGIFIENMLAE